MNLIKNCCYSTASLMPEHELPIPLLFKLPILSAQNKHIGNGDDHCAIQLLDVVGLPLPYLSICKSSGFHSNMPRVSTFRLFKD